MQRTLQRSSSCYLQQIFAFKRKDIMKLRGSSPSWTERTISIVLAGTASIISCLHNNNNAAHGWLLEPCRSTQRLGHSPFFATSTTTGTSGSGTTASLFLLNQHHQSSSSRLFSTATTAPDDEKVLSPLTAQQKPDNKEEEKLIAKGTIVNNFKGGLVAIRIQEEIVPTKSNGNDSDCTDSTQPLTPSPTATTLAPPLQSQETAASSVSGDLLGKRVRLPNNDGWGVIVAHRPPLAFCFCPDVNRKSDADNLIDNVDETSSKVVGKGGSSVNVYNALASVSVTDQVRVVDCFGQPLLPQSNALGTTGTTTETLRQPIFAPIPQVKDIALINHPMLTGITMMDTLSPIGQGQNILMVGYDGEEMQNYALDILQTQLDGGGGDGDANKKKTRCIYATSVANQDTILERLKERKIADNVHIVAPTPGDKDNVSQAAEAVAIAGAACAIGEAYALKHGENSLVIVDTIDMHKTLWDATTRVLVDEFGVEAVVEGDRKGGASSEMRAFYSSLIQRSAQYNKQRGGGSVTLVLLTTIPRIAADEETVFQEANFQNSPQKVKERIQLLIKRNIPLTAANLRKIDIPIPSASEGGRRMALQHVDDLISMSDGQIWLDERLEGRQEPPMDPQRSLTRIGIGADTVSRADAPALRRVAEGLRLTLSQAASLDGAEATKATLKQTQRQQALLLAMHQKSGTGGRRLSESCVALLAASEGHLDQRTADGAVAGSEAGAVLINDLIRHVWDEKPDRMREIDESLDISASTRVDLLSSISSFFENK